MRAGAERRSVKTPAAIFLATAGLVVTAMTATSLVADAQEAGSMGAADSDGNVPVRSVCFGAEQGGEQQQQQYVGEQQQFFGEQPYVGEQQYFGGQQYVGEQQQYFGGQPSVVPQYAVEQYDAGVQYATGGGAYTSEQLALYSWVNDGYATYGEISIDDCALDAMGAGPEDRERVLAHERGHANGLLHSDNPSDLMYPIVPITGV